MIFSAAGAVLIAAVKRVVRIIRHLPKWATAVFWFVFTLPLPLQAHEFWIEPSSFQPDPDQSLTADLLIGTDFHKQVWKELQKIPFGETRTYAEVALSIGRRTASRAVGTAIGANPIPVVIPCHRVIGSNQSLTGFSGGLENKAFLLF